LNSNYVITLDRIAGKNIELVKEREKMVLRKTGYLTKEELINSNRYPSKERLNKGPVAIIECTEEIPCNPCEAACKFKAIKIGKPITNVPVLDEDLCVGCGMCIAKCPGLAIFVIDKTYSDNEGLIMFPYEYLPLPIPGSSVEAVDRAGKVISSGKVIRVLNNKSLDRTPVVTIAIPKEKLDEVRGIKRLESKHQEDNK
jgi:Fe-S-cluster-containing hydrogenase component 2